MTLLNQSLLDDSTVEKQNRAHSRVKVKLDVMVNLNDGHFVRSQTINVSEGGILLNRTRDLVVSAGCKIQVYIPGIISDTDPQSHRISHIFTMQLIRQTDDSLGLQFL